MGEVGNDENMMRVMGKEGDERWSGVSKKVRGKEMKKVEKKNGGGEGSKFGKKKVNKWGVKKKGKKKRRKKSNDKLIVSRSRK